MDDIKDICIEECVDVNPKLLHDYETQLAVAWTMDMCLFIIQHYMMIESQYCEWAGEFLGIITDTNPFKGEKTWMDMQDAIVEALYEGVFGGD